MILRGGMPIKLTLGGKRKIARMKNYKFKNEFFVGCCYKNEKLVKSKKRNKYTKNNIKRKMSFYKKK